MQVYRMEVRDESGTWSRATWGAFEDYEEAVSAAAPLLDVLGVEPADFRIKPVEDFEDEGANILDRCNCGGFIIYDHHTDKFRCEACQLVFKTAAEYMEGLESSPAVKHKIRFAIFTFLSRFFDNLARNCFE